MFNAYIYSRVCYGIQCYGHANKTDVNKVQVICNKLLKILMQKDRNYSTNQLFKENKLLKIEDMHQFVILQLVHKSLYGNDNTPETTKSYFHRISHRYDVRHNLLVNIPRVKSAIGSTGTYWFGAKIWNSLPYDIRQVEDLHHFKQKLGVLETS